MKIPQWPRYKTHAKSAGQSSCPGLTSDTCRALLSSRQWSPAKPSFWPPYHAGTCSGSIDRDGTICASLLGRTAADLLKPLSTRSISNSLFWKGRGTITLALSTSLVKYKSRTHLQKLPKFTSTFASSQGRWSLCHSQGLCRSAAKAATLLTDKTPNTVRVPASSPRRGPEG